MPGEYVIIITKTKEYHSYFRNKKVNTMHNVGKIDRAIRLVAAATLVILYFTNVLESSFFLFLSFILVMTSLRRCCPIYALLGLGTCGVHTTETKTKIDTDKLKLK